MRSFLAVLVLTTSLLANEAESFFKASADNFLLCRAGYETYVMISSANASIQTINGTKYFRFKQRDFYFPLAGCKPVSDHQEEI